MGKGIYRIDKAFGNYINTPGMALPEGFKLLGKEDSKFTPTIDCEYESDLIPEVVEGTELPIIFTSFYQDRVDENLTRIRLADIYISGEFEKGKTETRIIYKREN